MDIDSFYAEVSESETSIQKTAERVESSKAINEPILSRP